MEAFDGRLSHPGTYLIAGNSGVGKTRWVQKLLVNSSKVFDYPPERIFWFYSQFQPIYTELQKELEHIEFIEGIPEENFVLDKSKRNLIVIDDLMSEINKSVVHLFTQGSHHRNLSVILLVQNFFFQGGRTISLNSHYIVYFKNPRDASSITFLGRQMFPGHSKYVQEAYEDATRKPYGYLFIDFRPSTPDKYRLQTGILPGETRYVYVKR